jgi:hypothetical protein
MNGNVGFNLPLPKPPRRNARQNVIAREEGVDVTGAVSYLEEAERGAVALTNEVRKFAAAADQLLKSGLTENAIILLIQDLAPKAHGRPLPRDLIAAVLKAASRLSEHLKPGHAR